MLASAISSVMPVQAQAPAADGDRPAFETASVKPNKSGAPRVGIGLQPGGLYTATNVTLQILIQNAYRVQPFQVTGGPSWMTSDRFDIVAKAGVALAPGQLQLMIQSLLADRFKLTVHRETREQPVFALVLARADGKIGAQLRKSESDCSGPQPGGRANAAPPPGPPAPGQAGPCGTTFGLGRLTANGTNMAQLATNLSGRVNRVVVDRTGLSGAFDVDLQWTPDPSEGAGPLGPLPPQLDGPPRPASDGPTLVTALQEQLGLKLDAQRAPVEILVIDRVEHPTED